MSHAPPPRWWPRILTIIALLTAALWAGATLRLETELLSLLPQNLPAVRGLDGFQRQFSSERELLLVAEEEMPEAERIAIFTKLRPALLQVPGVTAVTIAGEDITDAAPLIAAWSVWNLPPNAFARAVATLEASRVREKLAALPDSLAGALDAEEMARRQFDPLGVLDALAEGEDNGAEGGFDFSERSPNALTIISDRPLIAFYECADFCNSIRDKVAQTLPGESRLLLTGRPAFTAEISTRMRGDMLLMMGVATTLVSAAFWLFYRSFRPLGWILFGQFLALGCGIIVARLNGGSLNVISMGFASILLGISMDYSILVYHHFASPFREDRAVWERLRRGIWFSAMTTAAAFLVLVFSSLPGLRQLVLLVATGLIASAFFATWLLPAAWLRKPPVAIPYLDRASSTVAGFMEQRGVLLLLFAIVVAMPMALWALRTPERLYSADMNRFQPTTSEAYRGQILLARNDPSWNDAIFLLQGKDWDAVKNAATAIEASFGKSSILNALIPSPQRQAANRAQWQPAAVRLASAFEEAGFGPEWSSSTLRFARTLDDAAAGKPDAFADLATLRNRLQSESTGSVRTIVRIPGAADMPTLPANILTPGVEVLPVSWIALKEQLNAASQADLQRLGGWALTCIVILCALAQRSLRMVLLNFTALALSFLLLSALLAATGTQLSAMSLLCLPLLIGLVIDYSLHVLMALEHDRGDLRAMYSHIGAPILLTGLASCIGFGAPMVTSQPALQNFGLVMDLGILSAVASCLFLLPIAARVLRAVPVGAKK